MADTPIKRALVSVTDKTGVVDFVKALDSRRPASASFPSSSTRASPR